MYFLYSVHSIHFIQATLGIHGIHFIRVHCTVKKVPTTYLLRIYKFINSNNHGSGRAAEPSSQVNLVT